MPSRKAGTDHEGLFFRVSRFFYSTLIKTLAGRLVASLRASLCTSHLSGHHYARRVAGTYGGSRRHVFECEQVTRRHRTGIAGSRA